MAKMCVHVLWLILLDGSIFKFPHFGNNTLGQLPHRFRNALKSERVEGRKTGG